MVDWAKKIHKSVSEDLHPGEEVVAGTFVQPAGGMARQIGMGVGGVAGAVVAGKAGKKRAEELDGANEAGIAATIPANEPLVLGLTPQRLVVWGHSKLSGKPKGYKTSVPIEQIQSVELDKKKLSYGMVVRFKDNSAVDFDIPKLGNPKEFGEAITNAVG